MIRERDRLLALLRALHDDIARTVVAASEAQTVEALSAIVTDEGGDTIFALDRISEERLVAFFAQRVAPVWSLVLVAEGLDADGRSPNAPTTPGVLALPHGLDPADAELRIIMDPVDGTRGLMYQKRPAWILTGVAPNRGPATSLADIELALQTEIPLAKQHLADQLWAVRGDGVVASRRNRLTGERVPLRLRPSQATTIEQGFATVGRFFPGMRDVLGAIDEQVMRAALGPARRDKAQSFEDQYICTGGQLYELLAGHDRFVADLRPLMEGALAADGREFSICAHPYDLAALLVAQEAGVIVTDPRGQPLDAPLDTTTNVAWVGYANAAIRAQMEAPLHEALRARRLI